MHMADALLSPEVGITMCAVSGAALAYSAAKIKKEDLTEKKIPVIAVTGAFVFAAQMINFAIPATGSSGHIGGGILLAAMIGGLSGLLALAAVLVIQCLLFADGGLLALGCNIFNMGIIPCMIIYPLIFKPILKKGMSRCKIMLASVLSVTVALQLGAFGVVLQTETSGITVLPLGAFLAAMQPIHLAIGLVEGLITGAVLTFVYSARPEILNSTVNGTKIGGGVSLKKTVSVLALATLIVGGGVSLYASAYPDGLEWSMEKVAGTAQLESEHESVNEAAELQSKTAIMPDYDYADGEDRTLSGTTVAGIVGSILTFALAGAAAFIISLFKRRRRNDGYSQQNS